MLTGEEVIRRLGLDAVVGASLEREGAVPEECCQKHLNQQQLGRELAVIQGSVFILMAFLFLG